MLIGLDPRLTPEVLYALASMGHGDVLTIVDANFPAHSAGLETPWGGFVDFGGDAIDALRAILTVFPIDTFDAERPPVRAMQQVHAPDEPADVVRAAQPIIAAAGFDIAMTERFEFYEHAKQSFVIIRTRERRFYGNFILRKGVIAPD